MTTVIIRKRFDKYNPNDFAQNTEGESLTQQQFQAECDVNNILAKYKKTNLITHINKHQGQFGDFSSASEYQDSLNRVMQAQESFDSIPSEIRKRFNNDPKMLIEFLLDPKNNDEAISLGLKQKPTAPPETIQKSMEKALASNDEKRQKNVKKD